MPLSLGFVFLLTSGVASESAVARITPVAEEVLDSSERRVVLDALKEALRTLYVFPASTPAIERQLDAHEESNAYADLTDPTDFASRLSQDLYSASRDLHFRVSVDPGWVVEEGLRRDPARADAVARAELMTMSRENFGFVEVRRLEGNIGYLRFDYFHDPEPASATVAAVTAFLAHCDALVIDLRSNNGGFLEMAQVLLSHLWPADAARKLLVYHDIQDGVRAEREQWTLPAVPGTRLPAQPVFVLTSHSTFSAAEWFAYVLRNQGRAMIVGEQTAGGAHPVGRVALNHRFVLDIPTGEIKDAIRGDDFEGVGVSPHVVVRASRALHTAHRHALEKLIADRPSDRDRYAWYLPLVEARLHPPVLAEADRAALVGLYGERRVWSEGGSLLYSWGGRGQTELIPLEKTLFGLSGIEDFRFLVERIDGDVVGLRRVYRDGSSVLHLKDR